jgi:acetyl-CoA carboxylase biotin carboxyl carrier protein
VNLSEEDVQDILRLLDTLPFGELVLETSRFTLRLRRSGDGVWAREMTVATDPAVMDPPPAAPAPSAPAPSAPAPSAPPAPERLAPAAGPGAAGLCEVRAPLPGTFYRAPNPGAPPFVDTGSEVAEDTVVAIIETMKLMNPVYAAAAGTVTQICLADGEFAARDAVLMRVRPQAG